MLADERPGRAGREFRNARATTPAPRRIVSTQGMDTYGDVSWDGHQALEIGVWLEQVAASSPKSMRVQYLQADFEPRYA